MPYIPIARKKATIGYIPIARRQQEVVGAYVPITAREEVKPKLAPLARLDLPPIGEVKITTPQLFPERAIGTIDIAKGVGRFAKAVGQAIARSFLAVGVETREQLLVRKEERRPFGEATYTPQTETERAIFGVDTPVGFKTVGEEVLAIGGEDFKQKWGSYSIPIGILIAGIDITPFGFGKTQLAKGIAKVVSKTDDVGKIVKTLKPLFKETTEENLIVLAKSLKMVNREKDVLKIITQAGRTRVAPVAPKAIKEVVPEVKAVLPPTPRMLGIAPEPAPFITRRARETTLLKERIRNIQKQARIENWGKARLNRELEKARIVSEKKIRTEQLKTLKVGIIERFKGINKGLREGTIATREDILKAGDELKVALKGADVDPADAKWFTDTFKNIRGGEDLAKKMPAILARIERLANVREIRTLKSGIVNELRVTRPKIGVRKVLEGKLGPEGQKQMDFLRGATKESVELTSRTTKGGVVMSGINGDRIKAITRIEENINKYGTTIDGVTSEIPPDVVRQNALLNMTGIQDMSVAELRSTLLNIQSLKKTGQLDILVKQSNKAAQIELIQDTAKLEFRSAKIGPEVVGVAAREMNPIVRVADSIENAILGMRNITEKITYSKEFRVAEWLGETIRVARNKYNRLGTEWGNAKVRAFKGIFGEKKIGKIYQEMGKEKLVFSGKNALGIHVEMKLNQFEAAYWWGLARDPTNIPIFTKNMDFTPEMFKALDNFVDPRMKRYTNFLMDDWLNKTIYPKVNERYRVKFGMDMPKNENYLPRLYGDKKFEEEITNLLMGDAFPNHVSTIPSGVKARIGSKAAFRRIGIEQVMRRHSEQMNQFIHFDEAISDARKVFTDPEVKNTILQNAGKGVYDTLINKIDDIARGGMATQMKLAAIDWFIGRFTQASLMFNWVPFMKQLTSFPAFTLGRGGLKYSELLSGSMIYYRNPVGWTKMLAESDFIFGRLTKGFNRETAIAFRQGSESFTIKEVGMTLKDFLGKAAITPTRGGDMVPILPGLVAKYLQATKRLQRTTKLSVEAIHKKALAEAETLASRTQQSPWIEDLGRIQTANSVGKAISMYSTTPIQYLRESIGAVRMWNRGQMAAGETVRTIITAWVVLPQLFQFVSNGFTWNNDRQMRALLLGPINYYPAAGNLMGTMYDAFAKGETWKSVASGISPLFSIPETAQQSLSSLHRLVFKDLSPEKQKKEWLRFAEKVYETIALVTGKLPSSAPRTIKGIADITQGDTQDPRRIWYSEYALDPGEEDEEEIGVISPSEWLKKKGETKTVSPSEWLKNR